VEKEDHVSGSQDWSTFVGMVGKEEFSVVVEDRATGKEEILYYPNPKMVAFHESDAPYTLSHGGRNSGKSTALRWDAHMRNLRIDGHRALLLRRTFPQLRGSHFDRAEVEAKKLGAKPFNRTHHFIEYHNASKLQFGHCESDAAILDYLSQEWDWIGFDELTTFTFDQFIRIAGSARTTRTSGRKAYVRAATNPIGTGASWVKRYFIDKSITFDENEKYDPKEWVDIQANLADNPHADRQEYERRLLMLPSEALRRAYKDGEWLVEGQFFSEFKETKEGNTWHCISQLPTYNGVPLLKLGHLEITRALDWGYSEAEPGVCLWVAHLPDGTAIVIKEWVFTRKIPEEAARIIKEKSEGMRIRYTVCDPRCFHEEIGESIADTFAKNGVGMIAADNDRENGWVRVHSWLVGEYADGVMVRPRLRFLNPTELGAGYMGAPYTIRTLPSLQVDPKKPSDISQGEGVEDHAADALRYWAMSRPAPSRVKIGDPFANLPPELRRLIRGTSERDDILGEESVR